MRAAIKAKVQRGRHKRAYSRTLYPPRKKPWTGEKKSPEVRLAFSQIVSWSNPYLLPPLLTSAKSASSLPTPQGTRDAIPEAEAEGLGKIGQYQRGERRRGLL